MNNSAMSVAQLITRDLPDDIIEYSNYKFKFDMNGSERSAMLVRKSRFRFEVTPVIRIDDTRLGVIDRPRVISLRQIKKRHIRVTGAIYWALTAPINPKRKIKVIEW